MGNENQEPPNLRLFSPEHESPPEAEPGSLKNSHCRWRGHLSTRWRGR